MQPGPLACGIHFKRDSRQMLSLHTHIMLALPNGHSDDEVLKQANRFFRSKHPYSKFIKCSQPEDLIFDCKPRESTSISTSLIELEEQSPDTDLFRKAVYNFDFCNPKNYLNDSSDQDLTEAANNFANDLLKIHEIRQEANDGSQRLTPLVRKSRGGGNRPDVPHYPSSVTNEYGTYRLNDDGEFDRI